MHNLVFKTSIFIPPLFTQLTSFNLVLNTIHIFCINIHSNYYKYLQFSYNPVTKSNKNRTNSYKTITKWLQNGYNLMITPILACIYAIFMIEYQYPKGIHYAYREYPNIHLSVN